MELYKVDLYKQGLRPLLFGGLRADPEWLHRRLIDALSGLAEADATRNPPLASWVRQQGRRAFCSAPSCPSAKRSGA
ncbi:hypothetical protein [Leptolyngbya sp. O-77]|uniref:hypothetical protein n=1 Tax=Leptolyngbya sp. O-77 TaxID=1080068 RepID=UPI00074D4AB7|nr:hypothetical protein [Leptolyngbya sp. O-77]BAU42930.1 hypothetical protein O77CONTIG1_02752 [Leptolyngbya sp. O-77]